MDSFWVGINGYGGKRKPLGDLNTSRDQVSKKPNLEEDFTAETKKSDRYYVSEYGYAFVDCAREAYYDNYTKMREKRRTIRPLDLLEAATDDAVTKCGGNRDDIYAFLLDSFPSQNMHTNYEIYGRQNADKNLEKERRKFLYDTETELEPEEYYDDAIYIDPKETKERYKKDLDETYYSNSENSEDSDNEVTDVEEELNTTNPEPPTNDLLFDDRFLRHNSFEEIEFDTEDLGDKNQDEIPSSQNPKSTGIFFPPNLDDKLEEDIDKELEGLLTQPNPDRVN